MKNTIILKHTFNQFPTCRIDLKLLPRVAKKFSLALCSCS